MAEHGNREPGTEAAESRNDDLAEELDLLRRRLEDIRARRAGGRERAPARRILVADGTRLVRSLMCGLLRGAGYVVEEAENGGRVFEILQERDFDLLIVDIHMPDVVGPDLLRKIRLVRNDVDLPVLVCCGSKERADCVKVGQYGVSGALQKPIEKDELLDKVESILASVSPKGSGPDPDVFNLAEFQERSDADAAFTAELLNEFLEDLPRTLAAIRKAVVESDGPALASAAHGLKGALLSISAPAAAEAARRLEEIGRTGDMAAGREGYRTLERAAHDLKSAVEPYTRA